MNTTDKKSVTQTANAAQGPTNESKKLTVVITGGSGYVGAMLAEQWVGRDDVARLILIDKEPETDLTKKLANRSKITFIQTNLAEYTWQQKVKDAKPDVIVHTAWQIRELYGKRKMQWLWNVGGSDNVFDLAFSLPSVKKLVYFSTVASYGAYPTNTVDHYFKEEEGFRHTDYLYAEEKRVSEEHLLEKYNKTKPEHRPQVFIVRPAAITGPRGRYMRIRFGLQSALSGQLKGSWAYSLVTAMVSFVPVTKKWLRQFIHEDDVNDIVTLFTFSDLRGSYEVFNICPPGQPVLGPDMAKAVGKRAVEVQPWLIRIVFFFMWHLTRGKITTSKGGWKSYSYPIAVDGSKLTRQYGYVYKYPSKEAFVKKEGRYAKYVK